MKKLVAADVQQHLPSHEREDSAEIEQELRDVLDERELDFALDSSLAKSD